MEAGEQQPGEAETPPPPFQSAYAVELLYESMPRIERRELDGRVRARLGKVDVIRPDEREFPWMYGHPELSSKLGDGSVVAALTAIMAQERRDPDPFAARLAASVSQSWHWPDAQAAVDRCNDSLLVSDVFASLLPPARRLGVFQKVLACVVEIARPLALHWLPAGKLIEPGKFLRSVDQPGPGDHPLAAAVNVRFFNVGGSETDMVMDTMGLAALGLPDLQCHFRGLGPSDVARVLYSYAFYLLDRGDVIEEGDTIEGPGDDQTWTARREWSLLEPRRLVIDFDPGAPHAAGEGGPE